MFATLCCRRYTEFIENDMFRCVMLVSFCFFSLLLQHLSILLAEQELAESAKKKTKVKIIPNYRRMQNKTFADYQLSLLTPQIQVKIESIERRRAAAFFDALNLERIGKREGKPRFMAELRAMLDNPQYYDERSKLRMLQFISNAYNDHIGAPRTTIKLYDGPESSKGFFNHTQSIYINRSTFSFHNDFADLVNTIVHENTHNAQDNPNIYSDPVLSRIYRANFTYYRNATTHGNMAYLFQPVEVGAFAAGDMAEFKLRQLVSANDNFLRPGFRAAPRSRRPAFG